MYRSRIAGTGSHLPPRKLTNHDIEKLVDTNDEWIRDRTGIYSRSMAEDGQGTSDLALIAAREALTAAKMAPEDLDLIIFATISPDRQMPSSACYLQHKLGCRNIMAFDLAAACTGWVYGATVADQFIRTGHYKNVLVIGAEILHHRINYQDRGTCILFGDGAGATIFTRADVGDKNVILSSHNHAEGSLAELLYVPAGGSVLPFGPSTIADSTQFLVMNGREIFKHAVRTMATACQEALIANGIDKSQVDWVIPHQANTRIIEAVAKHFDISMDKVIINIEHMGNTSAATVPVALDESIRAGKIKRGDLILFTAFGSGLTSGSLLVRY